MKTIEEFKAFYAQQLLPQLQEYEHERISIVIKIWMTRIILIFVEVLILAAAFHYNGYSQATGDIFATSCIGMGILYFFIYNGLTSNYINTFKQEIIRKIIAFTDDSFTYSPERMVSCEVFQSSQLFTRIAIYTGSDYVKGVVNDNHLEFSEINMHYTSENALHRSFSKFKGIFLVSDFNKKFDGIVYVLPANSRKLQELPTDALARKKQVQLIRMDDPGFEKEFIVYGSEPVQTNYVLSTSLMERILDYKNKCRRRISISFTCNRLFMAIDYYGTPDNLFAPQMFKTLLDGNEIQSYFEDIALFIGVVADLNLNTRIWGRQPV